MALALPRGVSDFGPQDAISINEICAVAEQSFKKFGFYPIITPAIELLETLNFKAYGEGAKNELYKIEGADEGLRYDFTVPLARFIAMNKDLPLPFKRYQIGNIWRMDEPQKMRHREFMQADVDIVGSSDVSSEAEVIAASAVILDSLNIEGYSIYINSRGILNAILTSFKIPEEKKSQATRLIDKLGKLSMAALSEQIAALGIPAKSADEMLNFITKKHDSDELLGSIPTTMPEAKPEVDRLKELLKLLKLYNIKGNISIDLSLARGLDYYTSTVWEFVIFEDNKRLPSIGGGGRYDKLIGLYLKKDLPAVGSSIGIGRLFDYIKGGKIKTNAKIYLGFIKKENQEYATQIANQMRASGVFVDLNLTDRNIAKQLEYANAIGIPYVGIIGNIERQAQKVKIRDMASGEEKLLSIDECITLLKG